MKRILLFFSKTSLFAFVAFLAVVFAHADEPAKIFNEANKLYEQGKFAEAAATYDKLVQSGRISVPLLFNLGNAYLKSGQIGRAIVQYRRAEGIAPRDPEIRANLELARHRVAEAKNRQGVFAAVVKKLTLNEWTVLTFFAVTFWFAMLAIREWLPSWRNSFRGALIALGLAALLSGTCLVKAIFEQTVRHAVVVVPEAVIRRGPFQESQSIFTIRDGAEVEVINQKDDWVEIADNGRRTGWLPAAQTISVHGKPSRTLTKVD